MDNPPRVCILTAGRGTRMGEQALHKALLPLGKKAIISHIIEKFSPQTEFVIALGDRAEQVKTYLEFAHPERRFIWAQVDNYAGAGSGPGYSLICCKLFLPSEFFFVACDTLWNTDMPLPTDSDWFGVALVESEASVNYCNFELDEQQRVVAIHDKKKVIGNHFRAFVGLCFVKSHEEFWKGLESTEIISGERQVSNGIKALVHNQPVRALNVDWMDTGDEEKYRRVLHTFEKFDFSKPDECLFIVNGRVVKYFANAEIAQKRVARVALNPEGFPEVSPAKAGFYWYPFVEGQTLYTHCNQDIFQKLLIWLEATIWLPRHVDATRLSLRCHDFYFKKTAERLDRYLTKYPGARKLRSVNGESVRPIDQLIKEVPWEILDQGKAVFFHGDLQFDNIIFDKDRARFTALDWRQDFGGEIEFGDLYYDLAKLSGGFILNYDYIKQDLFSYSEVDGDACFEFSQRPEGAVYQSLLEDFCRRNQLSLKRMHLLVPIIFLNMAPLHHAPFDQLLFALGVQRLQRVLSPDFSI